MKTLQNRFAVPLASAIVAVAVVTAVWFQTRPAAPELEVITFEVRHTDFAEITGDLNVLSESADAVVMGRVTEVTWSGIDRADDRSVEVPATLYKVDVQEAMKGQVGSSIYVYRTDPEFFPDQPLTKLTVGELVVLYLNRHATQSPIESYSNFVYVPLALDNGVFDVAVGAGGIVNDQTSIVPRGVSGDMFAPGTAFTTAEIRAAIP